MKYLKQAIISAIILLTASTAVFAVETCSPEAIEEGLCVPAADASMVCSPGTSSCCTVLAADLGLNIQQKQKVKEFCERHTPKLNALSKQLETEEKKLADILNAPKPDKSTALAQAKKVSAVKAEIDGYFVLSVVEVRSILTPAQSAKLSSEDMMKAWTCMMQTPQVTLQKNAASTEASKQE